MNAREKLSNAIVERLSRKRVSVGLTTEKIEQYLGIGSGWIHSYEEGTQFPDFFTLIEWASYLKISPEKLFENLKIPNSSISRRSISATSVKGGINIFFEYSQFDAKYHLPNATTDEFNSVLRELRKGLADQHDHSGAVKRDAVVSAFFKAVNLWPKANPSDIWWFIIYRAYCDRFNHPVENNRLDLSQSWKRTGGWALEKIVVDFYSDHLSNYDIKITIADDNKKADIVSNIKVKDRLEADKIDVVLEGLHQNKYKFFGVVHVKASFAERRTDDIHMSQLLKSAGYLTPLWTMDCKSSPSKSPKNRGELGKSTGNRSAKRRDIEDEGYFTRCFSYNKNTELSSSDLPADRKIYQCDFTNPDDAFSRFIVKKWENFIA